MNYLYSCRLRNKQVPESSEAHEVRASIVISAKNPKAASRWGNSLAECFCSRHPSVQKIASIVSRNLQEIPESIVNIRYGEYATDEQVGWSLR